MKYVTLEHRQSLPYGVIGCTYTKFDTNDTQFETEAHEKRHQRNSKQEEAKNQIIDESGQLFGTILQIKNELNDLRNGTPILKRFSKAYRTKRDRLQKQVQDCQIRNNKLLKEAERLEERTFDPFHEYYDLKTLLKEQGYVLVSKTTDDRYTTTEIWHKDD